MTSIQERNRLFSLTICVFSILLQFELREARRRQQEEQEREKEELAKKEAEEKRQRELEEQKRKEQEAEAERKRLEEGILLKNYYTLFVALIIFMELFIF